MDLNSKDIIFEQVCLREYQILRAKTVYLLGWKECPPWSELHVANGVHWLSFGTTSSNTMHVWGKKPHVILHRRLGGVLCAFRTWLLKPLVTLLYVIVCKHDMGTLSCLKKEAIERAPTSLFGGLVRGSVAVLSWDYSMYFFCTGYCYRSFWLCPWFFLTIS